MSPVPSGMSRQASRPTSQPAISALSVVRQLPHALDRVVKVVRQTLMLATISPQPSEASIAPGIESRTDDKFHWTPGKICLSLFLFLVAGLAEIGGGWLVWQTIREHKAWWWAVLGALVLVAYGFVPTAQPVDNFGRVFAVYGGFFIILSYLWGWALDGDRPDKGDWIGSGIALAGVAVAWFWKR